MEIIGYNMKLKKSEKMNSASLVVFKGEGGRKDRYAAKGKGSDGTTMYKILGKDDFEKLKASGLSVEIGKAKAKKSKKSKSGGACQAVGGKKKSRKSRGSRK